MRTPRGSAMAPEKYCRKGLPGLRQGPYGVATAASLDDESGPAASPGGPYGKKKGPKMTFKKTGKFSSGNAVRAPLGVGVGQKWRFRVKKQADFG